MSTKYDWSVTVTPAVIEVMQNAANLVAEVNDKIDNKAGELSLVKGRAAADEYLATARYRLVEMQASFIRCLTNIMRSNEHDGDVSVTLDGTYSLFFRYDSGYHGGMIFHASYTEQDQEVGLGSWSIHT